MRLLVILPLLTFALACQGAENFEAASITSCKYYFDGGTVRMRVLLKSGVTAHVERRTPWEDGRFQISFTTKQGFSESRPLTPDEQKAVYALVKRRQLETTLPAGTLDKTLPEVPKEFEKEWYLMKSLGVFGKAIVKQWPNLEDEPSRGGDLKK